MAVTWGPFLSAQVKGSVGDFTFDRYRGAQIVRKKPGMKADYGPMWQAVKVNMKTVQDGWVSIGAGLQRLWNQVASNIRLNRAGGGKKTLKGREWFFKVNMRRARWGLSLIDEPSLGGTTNFPTLIFSIEPTGPNNISMQVNLYRDLAEGEYVEFWTTLPMDSRSLYFDRARLYATILFDNQVDIYTVPVPTMFAAYGVGVWITQGNMRQSVPLFGLGYNAPA